MKKCPECGLIRPDSQLNCDCHSASNSEPNKELLIIEEIKDKDDPHGTLKVKLSLAPGAYDELKKLQVNAVKMNFFMQIKDILSAIYHLIFGFSGLKTENEILTIKRPKEYLPRQ